MTKGKKAERFNPSQIETVNNSVVMAEEVVCNHFKMSTSQWRRLNYDIKTQADLSHIEIVDGPFAQVIRYQAKRKNSDLSSSADDFYKICLQDHSILSALQQTPSMALFPFALYIVTHELIHVVRFRKYFQNFDAPLNEKLIEEAIVHENTHRILQSVPVSGLSHILSFYEKRCLPVHASPVKNLEAFP